MAAHGVRNVLVVAWCVDLQHVAESQPRREHTAAWAKRPSLDDNHGLGLELGRNVIPIRHFSLTSRPATHSPQARNRLKIDSCRSSSPTHFKLSKIGDRFGTANLDSSMMKDLAKTPPCLQPETALLSMIQKCLARDHMRARMHEECVRIHR